MTKINRLIVFANTSLTYMGQKLNYNWAVNLNKDSRNALHFITNRFVLFYHL